MKMAKYSKKWQNKTKKCLKTAKKHKNGEKQAKMVKNRQNGPKMLTTTCHPI